MKFAVSMAYSDATHWCELARVAEAHDWDSMIVSDHLIHPETIRSPYPYTEDGAPRWEAATPWPDPWLGIAAMAAVTQRIRFFTGIYVLPMRNPFAVAKTVSTAAAMSGGRVALGIGVGWMEEEFEAMGQDFHRRGRRTDEMIEVMRKLWTGEVVEHHGEFYDFEPLRMRPAPAEKIPLYVGGLSEAALRRVARLGDGWVSDLHSTEELATIVKTLRRYLEEAGRGGESLEVVAACSDAGNSDGFRRLEEVGVTQVICMPWIFYGGSTESLNDKLEGVKRFAEVVIAPMR